MANEQHTVRSISWLEVFSCAHIFKSFKMAIHPTKIVLALAAILLTGLFGWVADRLWTGASDSNWVQKDEPWDYWKQGRAGFMDSREQWLKGRLESLRPLPGGDAIAKEKNLDDAFEKLAETYKESYDKSMAAAAEDYKKAVEAAGGLPKEQKEAALEAAGKAQIDAEHNAWYDLAKNRRTLASKRGQRIFSTFVKWEMRCVTNAVRSVTRGNIVSGLSELSDIRAGKSVYPVNVSPDTGLPKASNNDQAPYGLVAWVAMMVWGLWWLVTVYPWYSLVLGLSALAVWSVLGGAICRIAALHAAREEKIPLSSAVKFGLSKAMSFFSAPLLPIVLIVVVGLLIAAGGLIGAIPYVGEWFLALLLPLALAMGAVIAFLAIGLGAGCPLMWPTIAVEGSDAFDAISRSFSYVFAKPFRYGFYWLVAAVYGTICYLFVRLFAFVTLAATHGWARWWMGLADRPTYAEGAVKLDVMWAKPTFWDFHGPAQWEAMGGSEAAASAVLGIWVYLVAAIVLAFLVTFFFSAATTIYALLRQKVDATDLVDAYVVEAEEEFPEEAPAPPAEEAPGKEESPGEESSE
ncbi:MAG TPA: hypothetical protein VM389_03265 [Phycisphaerae bacterium]|nr:hypothetical protein [Phycisphaerae bacterium]